MVDDSLIKGDIVFNAKPDAVPYNYRISYKVSQLCLIMRICGWGDSCSLIKQCFELIVYGLKLIPSTEYTELIPLSPPV